jgi:hypothetical protein
MHDDITPGRLAGDVQVRDVVERRPIESTPTSSGVTRRVAAVVVAVSLSLSLALSLSLSACSSDDAIPLGGGLVVPRAGGGDPDGASLVTPEEEASETSLASAEAAWREGDALSAYSIANQALRGHASPAIAEALRQVRSRARAALVATEIVRIAVRPEVDAVTAGGSVPVAIRFTNRSAAELVVPARIDESSTALLLLDVRREDLDIYGNVAATSIPLRVPLAADLHVPPGGSVDVHVLLPVSMTTFSHQGFAVLDVGGTFRPVLLRVGETEFFDALPLASAPVRVFMPNYEQLADDPVAALARSVEKRSPPHILTAAELLAPRDRAAALDMLARAAERDPDLAFVLDATAARLRRLSK